VGGGEEEEEERSGSTKAFHGPFQWTLCLMYLLVQQLAIPSGPGRSLRSMRLLRFALEAWEPKWRLAGFEDVLASTAKGNAARR
jgi:hypothetical protein